MDDRKPDLDAIEARAAAAMGAPRNMDRLSYWQFVIDVANPETVVALVARVRELESALSNARWCTIKAEQERLAAIARAEQAERRGDEYANQAAEAREQAIAQTKRAEQAERELKRALEQALVERVELLRRAEKAEREFDEEEEASMAKFALAGEERDVALGRVRDAERERDSYKTACVEFEQEQIQLRQERASLLASAPTRSEIAAWVEQGAKEAREAVSVELRLCHGALDEANARAEQAEKACAELWSLLTEAEIDQREVEVRAEQAEGIAAALDKTVAELRASRDERPAQSEWGAICASAAENAVRLAEVEAQCAAMRSAVVRARSGCACQTWQVGDIDAALGHDAGRALLAELAALRELEAASRRFHFGGGYAEAVRAALAKLDALKAGGK